MLTDERAVPVAKSTTDGTPIPTYLEDNILDHHYIDTLFPMLADAGLELELFYEVKADLTAEQMRTLSAARVRNVQPGIEALATSTLKLMKKGTSEPIVAPRPANSSRDR